MGRVRHAGHAECAAADRGPDVHLAPRQDRRSRCWQRHHAPGARRVAHSHRAGRVPHGHRWSAQQREVCVIPRQPHAAHRGPRRDELLPEPHHQRGHRATGLWWALRSGVPQPPRPPCGRQARRQQGHQRGVENRAQRHVRKARQHVLDDVRAGPDDRRDDHRATRIAHADRVSGGMRRQGHKRQHGRRGVTGAEPHARDV